MHDSSQATMRWFTHTYLHPDRVGLWVLDIGSYDVNGTYKALFVGHNYRGLDLHPGPNVDIVAPDPDHYPPGDASYDIVVSGQTIEHCPDTVRFMQEIARILAPGGLVCIIGPGPTMQGEHRYPQDCWRVLPDAFRWLCRRVGLTVIDTAITPEGDSYLVAVKCWGAASTAQTPAVTLTTQDQP
jgi:SAM-dependent methyltransferase